MRSRAPFADTSRAVDSKSGRFAEMRYITLNGHRDNPYLQGRSPTTVNIRRGVFNARRGRGKRENAGV
jgi:hypothetical protein